jgi:hypothetical protein
MFGFGKKKEKIEKSIKKVEDTIKKDASIIKEDIKKAEDVVKKDINIAKEDIKKLETYESFDIFITYGWAIAVIIIGLIGFVWWQYFNIEKESCDFLEGNGLLCENFDVTNSSIDIIIRNLNNGSITVEKIKMSSCFITPAQKISDNDKSKFIIPCNISSGRFSERVVVDYTIEEFNKHATAKLRTIVP